MAFIEKGHHQVFPLQQQNRHRNKANRRQLNNILRGNCQNIAENNGLDIHRGRIQRHHKQANTEKRGEDQADNRVFLQLRALVKKQHAARGQPAGKKRPQRKGQTEHISARHAGDNGVGEGVANQRPAFEHQVAREKCAHPAYQGRNPHRIQHIVITKRLQQPAHLSPPAARRLINGRSSSVIIRSSAPLSTTWRSTPLNASSRFSAVKVLSVGPLASTVPLTITV